jgi:hypothetical protein
MFEDIYEQEPNWKDLHEKGMELLKEAKKEIERERSLRDAIEHLYHETVEEGKDLADLIKQYRAKHGRADFDYIEFEQGPNVEVTDVEEDSQ